MGTGSRAIALTAPLCASLALLTGCGDDGAADDGSAPTMPAASAPTTTPPTTPPATPRGGPAASPASSVSAPTETASRSGDLSATPLHPARITGITTARYDAYDRVLLHVADALPDYDVSWLPRDEQLRQPGSGRPTTVEGDRVLMIVLHNTRDPHPSNSTPELPAIRQVRDFGAYEQVTTVALGVATLPATEVGFRVESTDDADPVLMIDIAHGRG